MEYISIEGAAQRLGMTEKEVNKLVQEGQLHGKTSYGVTTVTKESVYAYTGLSADANQTKKKGKGGRPPAGVSYEEAAEMLGEDIPELVGMRKLETYNTGNGFIITKRSIKAYQEKLAVKEVEEVEYSPEDKYNDNFDMSEERALNDGKTPPEYENESEPQELTHDPLVAFTDFTGVPDAGPSLEKNEDDAKLLSDLEAAWIPFTKVYKEEEVECREESVTMSKEDFHASLTVAAMRGELKVYRSLKSFERR